MEAISCLFSRCASVSFLGLFQKIERPTIDKSLLRHFMSMLALVIDDSMLIRHTVCRFLETRGFTVETASNGIAALEALKSIRPDLIVTDLQMPKLSGYQLIDALKSKCRNRGHPCRNTRGKTFARQPTGDASPHFYLQRPERRGAAQPGPGKPLSAAYSNLNEQ